MIKEDTDFMLEEEWSWGERTRALKKQRGVI